MTVEQKVSIYTLDGNYWPINLDVESTARLLEDYNSDLWTLTVLLNDGAMLHFYRESVACIMIENKEDMREGSKSTAPPAKSRRKAS